MLIISGFYPSVKVSYVIFLCVFVFFKKKINHFFLCYFFFPVNVLYWFPMLNFMNCQNLSKSCNMSMDLLLHTGSLSSYYCMTEMRVFHFSCGI
jgi:hypothetical protein